MRGKLSQLIENKGLKVICGLLLVAYFAVLLVKSPLGTRWVDFPVYYEAAQKAADHRTVYDVPGHFQFKYAPLLAVLFALLLKPFAFETGSWIFQKTMLAGYLVLLVFFIAHVVRDETGSGWKKLLSGRAIFLAGLTTLFFGNALRLELQLGQINAVVLATLYALFVSYDVSPGPGRGIDTRRSFGRLLVQSLLLAFAIQLKLYACVFLPYFFFRKDWNLIVLAFALIGGMSLGIPALYHGWDFALLEFVRWLQTLTNSTGVLLVHETNIGLLGTASRYTSLEIGKWIWAALGFAFTGLLFALRDAPSLRVLAWGLFGIVLLNPLVWTYWVLFLAPLFIPALDRRLFGPREELRLRGWFFWGSVIFCGVSFNLQHSHLNWAGGLCAATLLTAWLAWRPLAEREI